LEKRRQKNSSGLYDSVEGLIDNIDKLKGKQKENVTNFAEQARLSKDLATIILDVPVTQTLDELVRQEPDEDVLKAAFEEWEFRTLTKRLFSKNDDSDGDDAPVFESLKNISDYRTQLPPQSGPDDEIEDLIEKLTTAESFCFDVETNSLDRFQAKLLGIAFSTTPQEAYYLPVSDWESLRKKIAPVLTSDSLKIGHNLKFDLAILLSHGIAVKGPFFDTMLAHILVAPDQKHTMDSMAENLLNYSPVKLVDLFTESAEPDDDLFAAAAKKKATKGDLDPSEIPTEKLAEYAAEDADVTIQLFHSLKPLLKERELLPLWESIEAPLLPVLVAMEAEGITVDQNVLDEVGKTLAERIAKLSSEIEASCRKIFQSQFTQTTRRDSLWRNGARWKNQRKQRPVNSRPMNKLSLLLPPNTPSLPTFFHTGKQPN
jgi:DNA polymerase-1